MITFTDDINEVRDTLPELRIKVKSGFIITNKVEQWN